MRSPILLIGIAALAGAAVDCSPAPATNGTARPPPATGAARPAAPLILVPPLNDAQTGEWATFVRGAGDGEHLVQMRVIGSSDTTVRVERTTYKGGRPQGRPTIMEWDRNGFGMPSGGVVRAIERDHLEIDGAYLPCWKVRVHSRHDIRFYWISHERPVHGVIQIDRVVKGRAEGLPFKLREWGFGQEEE